MKRKHFIYGSAAQDETGGGNQKSSTEQPQPNTEAQGDEQEEITNGAGEKVNEAGAPAGEGSTEVQPGVELKKDAEVLPRSGAGSSPNNQSQPANTTVNESVPQGNPNAEAESVEGQRQAREDAAKENTGTVEDESTDESSTDGKKEA